MGRLVTILCFLFISCETNRIKNDLNLLYSVPVKIPNDMTVIYNGKDTNIVNCKNGYKFIVYVDSSECNSCEINKLLLWQPLIKYAEMFDERLKFYFILCSATSSDNSIRRSLLSINLNYPVYLDYDDKFKRSNFHLKNNTLLNAFMLDNGNNVILVGNPLYNKKIEHLFYSQTQVLLK